MLSMERIGRLNIVFCWVHASFSLSVFSLPLKSIIKGENKK